MNPPQDTGSPYFPISMLGRKIRPLKKVLISMPNLFLDDQEIEREKELKRYQIKNPKWTTFFHQASDEENYKILKAFKKFKSLQLTSIVFNERQDGATVGHFNGEIKYLEKGSRYLKKLDFEAGAVSKRRFIDVKRWIRKQKHLMEISLVPYWFPKEREDDINDRDEYERNTKGVISLLHPLSHQIRKLTLFGFISEELKNGLNFKKMNHLQQLTLKAAFRPEASYQVSEEFKDIHIELIKKVLKSNTLKILTLYSETDDCCQRFWKSFKELVAIPPKNPLVVHAKIDHREHHDRNIPIKWWKKNFSNLPQNIKITFTIHWTSYFLSLPQGVEIMGIERPEIERNDGGRWLGVFARPED